LAESRLQGTATIAGRKLHFHKRSMDSSGKCNIAIDDGSINVAVYELYGEERAELDVIEGLGSGYAEEIIEVPGFGDCFTYAATPSHIDDGLRPYAWYKELVLAGCEYLEFPADYLAMILDIESIDDPDNKRHATNMGIAELARNSANTTSI
jgi:hypothetical protein